MMNKKLLAIVLSMQMPLVAIVCLLLSVSAISPVGMVRAANESSVTLSVTVQNVAVEVDPITYAFGTVVAGQNTTSTWNASDVGMYFEANNTGNVNESFTIRGANATDTDAGGSNTWVLESAAGSDEFVIWNSTDGTIDTEGGYNTITLSAVIWNASVTVYGTPRFDLKLTLPSSTSSYLEHKTTVTIGAVAA